MKELKTTTSLNPFLRTPSTVIWRLLTSSLIAGILGGDWLLPPLTAALLLLDEPLLELPVVLLRSLDLLFDRPLPDLRPPPLPRPRPPPPRGPRFELDELLFEDMIFVGFQQPTDLHPTAKPSTLFGLNLWLILKVIQDEFKATGDFLGPFPRACIKVTPGLLKCHFRVGFSAFWTRRIPIAMSPSEIRQFT